MNKIYIGIDNGVTGTITIIFPSFSPREILHFTTPTKKELSYTKKKQYITRIDTNKIKALIGDIYVNLNYFCLIERPMINPTRWKASMSAIRALEATLIVLEELQIPYQYIDSKEWQKEFLPSGIKETYLLKSAAINVAKRLFPDIRTKDADSLLIAEYARRKNL